MSRTIGQNVLVQNWDVVLWMTFQVRQHSIAGMCCLNGDIISLVKNIKYHKYLTKQSNICTKKQILLIKLLLLKYCLKHIHHFKYKQLMINLTSHFIKTWSVWHETQVYPKPRLPAIFPDSKPRFKKNSQNTGLVKPGLGDTKTLQVSFLSETRNPDFKAGLRVLCIGQCCNVNIQYIENWWHKHQSQN